MRRVAVAVLALGLSTAGCGDSPNGPPTPPPTRPALPPVAATPSGLAPEGTVSLARNLYFILDGSGSMAEDPTEKCAAGPRSRFPTKIAAARWAMGEFLHKVPADDRLGLYVFDQRGQREVVPLGTGNREQVLDAVEKVHVDGGTPLAEAIIFGVDRLVAQREHQLGYGDFRLVVVTDGEATGRRLEDATSHALAAHIPIYTIGFCVGRSHALFRHSLAYRAANSPEELAHGLEDTLGELDHFDMKAFGDS